jgi:DUF438 domain-containing protein
MTLKSLKIVSIHTNVFIQMGKTHGMNKYANVSEVRKQYVKYVSTYSLIETPPIYYTYTLITYKDTSKWVQHQCEIFEVEFKGIKTKVKNITEPTSMLLNAK